MKYYELRSDTFTQPSEMMRKAMATAEVGDDVYAEDPSINRLEALAAEITGKEAALFVTSGSMGNLIPLFVNGGPLSEVLTHTESHIIQHEVGAVASIAGVLPVGIATPRGILSVEALEPHIKPHQYDLTKTAMIEVENTIGGICYPLETLRAIKALAEKHQILVHLDGARIFNASIATGVAVKEFASCADTLSFCISKGLGAPVGSLICGDAAFIGKARSVRKVLGGGMRQGGILAAAGIYALEHNVERLGEDHAHARQIAETLAQTGWAQLELEDVETNMVFFSVKGHRGPKVAEVLDRHGIRSNALGDTIRFVTHLDFSEEDCQAVCTILANLDEQEFLT